MEEKKKIIRTILEHASESQKKGNSDITDLLKDLMVHPERILDDDGTFHFNDEKCSTCKENCCIGNRIIRITPIDIDLMMERSPFGKIMSRNDFVNIYFDTFLGGESLNPMGIVKFIEPAGVGFKLCPFVAFLVEKSGLLGNKIKNIAGRCILGQKEKPNVCMLFPLGRIADKDGKSIFFRQECPGTKTKKETRISEFLEGFDEKGEKFIKYVNMMNNVITKLKDQGFNNEMIERAMNIYRLILFYEEGNDTFEKLKKINDKLNIVLELLK